jgi:hypothetical protein
MKLKIRNIPKLSKDQINRFWSKVKIGNPDECWEWQGKVGNSGYGRFWVDGNLITASRVAYSLANDIDLPIDILVCHTCDNRKCINPSHLFLGTHKDNNQDAIKKGRRIPEFINRNKTPTAKLNPEQVLQIRKFYQDKKYTSKELSVIFNVTQVTICYVISKRTWSHI